MSNCPPRVPLRRPPSTGAYASGGLSGCRTFGRKGATRLTSLAVLDTKATIRRRPDENLPLVIPPTGFAELPSYPHVGGADVDASRCVLLTLGAPTPGAPTRQSCRQPSESRIEVALRTYRRPGEVDSASVARRRSGVLPRWVRSCWRPSSMAFVRVDRAGCRWSSLAFPASKGSVVGRR